MLPRGVAGLALIGGRAAFAPASEPVIGNNNPAWTGSHTGPPDRPGPSPKSPGYVIGGQTGDTDGFIGSDPGSPGGQLPANPRVVRLGAEQETWNAPGIIGWNDQLQVRDRHAYWDRGSQRTGVTPSVPGNPPNPHSDGPARASLKLTQRSLNPQIGSDNTANQDDLSRPYTWLGQQDGTSVPVYGGVPGLWASYGNRGFSDRIHDPTNGEGGLMAVSSGPPHGLHSDTIPEGKQIADRYKANPQMRPVRIDRPSNSTIAGQSFSQTVQFQGQTGTGGASQSHGGLGLSFNIGGGWRGGAVAE